MATAHPTTSFKTKKLNSTTFLITEDDSYKEHPYIYAKLHSKYPVLILSDTSCNSPRDKDVSISSLRQYLETHPLEENGGRCLNPLDSNRKPEREYIVICTHCHFDHIGGIEQFTSKQPSAPSSSNLQPLITPSTPTNEGQFATIVASSHDRSFLTHHLSTHSLCEVVGMPTPRYKISHWAKNWSSPVWRCHELDDITIIHTPGHTPDELAWYDHEERWLYVGDSFYERGEESYAIVFPKEGNWKDFMPSMRNLLTFVRHVNDEEEKRVHQQAGGEDSTTAEEEEFLLVPSRVKVACGHSTSCVDGEDVIEAVIAFFGDVIAGRVPVKKTWEGRGETINFWEPEESNPRFSVHGPARLAEEARGKS